MTDNMIERVQAAIEMAFHDAENLDRTSIARAAIAAMPGWEPIETAPKDAPRLLLGWRDPEFPPGHCGEGYWDDGYVGDPHQPSYSAGWCIPSLNYFNVTYPTHWMRLPAPPNAALKPEVQA